MSKLEATAGSSLPKESDTLGSSGGLGNVLLGNKREIRASKELLVAGLLFTKRQGDWVTTSEREIQYKLWGLDPSSALPDVGPRANHATSPGISFLINKKERQVPSHLQGLSSHS